MDWQTFHARNPEVARALARVWAVIVGLGAMGSFIAEVLARAGMNLIVIDPDRLEGPNLHRHAICDAAYIGWPKVNALVDRLSRTLPPEFQAVLLPFDVLTLDVSYLISVFRACDVVIAATGNHAANLFVNHLCRIAEVDLVIPSLWANDPVTVGDVYHLPYEAWEGSRGDRDFGCYACDDRAGRPNELSAQPGTFAEIAWVGAAAAELAVGRSLPDGHRTRMMVDGEIGVRNYYIFERSPLRTIGGAVEINPDCTECSAAAIPGWGNWIRSQRRGRA